METRHLLPPDIEVAFKINEEYLSAAREEFFHWYQANPDLFVGLFDETALIGICYGMDWLRQPQYVVLEGIATRESYWRSGAGSQLIQFFEAQVQRRGRHWVTVGVAADLKTENFYLKNGYTPTQFCAKVPKRNLPPNYAQLGYHFCEIRDEGEYVILYVETSVRDKERQARLKEDLGAEEVIFIMEKAL
ncbi:MAG: GNAT family N-acetyltransferase [Caldilineaceae bacterium]